MKVKIKNKIIKIVYNAGMEATMHTKIIIRV